MGGSEIGCFSKVVEGFFELEGLPDSLGTVSDSNSSNDFLRSLPWVVGSWLQAAGTTSLREGHEAPGPQDSCGCLLPAEVEDLAGGVEGDGCKRAGGEAWWESSNETEGLSLRWTKKCLK